MERLLKAAEQPGEAELQAQIQKTGSTFAVDMLLLKLVLALLAGGHPLRGNELKTMNAEFAQSDWPQHHIKQRKIHGYRDLWRDTE